MKIAGSVFGIFSSLQEVFVDFLGVFNGVGVVVSAGNSDGHFSTFVFFFLGEIACGLEIVFSLRHGTVEEVYGAEAHVVERLIGICADTLLEVVYGLGLVALSEVALAEVVVGESFVGGGIVEGAFEDGAGVVILPSLVVLDTVLVALALSAGHERAREEHRH